MNSIKKLEPKERILQSAIKLFAAKGYNRVGMRELAGESQVGLSMINYHFGNKAGVLKAINNHFFSQYIQNAQEILLTEDPIEVRFEKFIDKQIRFFKSDPELVTIALTELPYNEPDVALQKSEYISAMIKNFRGEMTKQLPQKCGGPFPAEIIGPILLGMMAMHFIMRPVLKEVNSVQLNDEFYERYIQTAKQIFLRGIMTL